MSAEKLLKGLEFLYGLRRFSILNRETGELLKRFLRLPDNMKSLDLFCQCSALSWRLSGCQDPLSRSNNGYLSLTRVGQGHLEFVV